MENYIENKINPIFWKNKKVFLTGCTGFKGSWLSLILLNLGAQVKGYSLPPNSQPSLFGVCKLTEQGFWINDDIRNKVALEQALLDFEPEIVIHLAAQALVFQSYRDPIETYETNVMGTANLLEACRKIDSLKAVLNVTSDKCYENKEWPWGYRENDPLGGYDPYSSSKACAELVTKAFAQSFFNPQNYTKHGVAVATARAGNVIGGGDWSENRLIADAARAFLAKKELKIRRPHSTRPWQHVLEPLRGYLMLCEQMYTQGLKFTNSAFNFGPYETSVCSVKEAISFFSQAWGEQSTFTIHDPGNLPHEAGLLKLDISKAQKELAWKPKLEIQQTMQITADWYKQFYSNSSQIKDFTLKQISDYL
jgi:CDP-glucose 4,6-dehydratase